MDAAHGAAYIFIVQLHNFLSVCACREKLEKWHITESAIEADDQVVHHGCLVRLLFQVDEHELYNGVQHSKSY